MKMYLIMLSVLLSLAAGCSLEATPLTIATQPSSTPTATPKPVSTSVSTAIPATDAPLSCEVWQSWPVVPSVSKTARELFQRGQTAGNNARAFSKIGDGEISAAWFLTAFDLGPQHYNLGAHQDLLPVIEHFAGSFERMGVAAKRGFNTDRILDASSNDAALCESGESPLSCELRLHRPAFAILSLGTNQVWEPDEFEAGMREMLGILLARNIVPILSTKGDNLEGDHRINRIIACLAYEHDLPLWNFWAAIQTLPNHGLQPDQEHLSYGPPDFADDQAMQTAWTIRNFTALQALNAVWRAVRP